MIRNLGKRRLNTFFARIFIGVLVVILCQTLFSFALHYSLESRFIWGIFEDKGRHIVKNFARLSATALYIKSQTLANTALETVLDDKFVMSVGLYDKDGSAWIINESMEGPREATSVPSALDHSTIKALENREVLSRHGSHVQLFICPVKIVPYSKWMLESFGEEAKEDTIGYAAVALSKDLLEIYSSPIRKYTIITGVITTLIGLFVAFFIAKRLSLPIRILSQKAKDEQVVQENLDFDLPGPVEIQELSEALSTFLRARRFFEQALTSERNRLRSVFEAIPDPVYVVGTDDRILFSNRAFNVRFGRPDDGPCYKRINQLDNRCPWCPVGSVNTTDPEQYFAFYHKTSKSFFEGLCRFFSTEERNGAWLFMLKDVTSWKLNQEALERELRENEVLNELSRSLLTVRDDPDKVAELVLSRAMELTRSSAGFVAMKELESGQMKLLKWMVEGQDCGRDQVDTMVFPSETEGDHRIQLGLHAHAINLRDGFYCNDPQSHEAWAGLMPKDHIKIENFMAAPALIEDEPHGLIGLANSKTGDFSPRDLKSLERISDLYALALSNLRYSEEKERLWKELRQAQKMEAIATLAGGIAHDFNNILAPIMGYAEILLMRAGSDEELKSGLKKIFDSAMRAKEIVAQILTFSRSREGEARPVSVTSIVKEVIKLLSSSIPKTISIETDIRGDIPPVVADPVHIHQILMNLCTNAFHAMEDQGGTLFVGLDVVEEKGVKYVKLTVSDTGQGIPSEHLHRIFEPYFTTKKLGKGTGLGLAIVHGIVEVYNGHLRVDSKVGQGTTFEVLLPARDGLGQPEGLEHDHPSSESITRFSGSILVVDDEDAVRRVLKGLVQELGLDVETASNAKEALQLLVEQKKTYDLIITDQTMPGMTGIELVKSLRQSGIETPVIICTGYNSKMDKRMGRELRIVDFLLKPVDVATLHRTLKKVFKR